MTSLPRFAELPGASLPIRPPFPFQGVSVRLLPLRADLGTLQRFVDNYLNIIPAELGRFRVPMPFVQLTILDYGRMAIEVGNYGWLAQREILFNVPLEWYEVKNGTWHFKDWASFSPYIYVDDDMSMTVGRTVYGWPKTTATVDATTSDWVRNPQAAVREVLVRTGVFSELYSAKRLEMEPLLEVTREAPPSLLRVPFDTKLPYAPWNVAAHLSDAAAGVARDASGWLSGLGLMPTHPGTSAANYLAMMDKMMRMGFPMRPDLSMNTLNLKQFRRAENPDQYCFQALTNGPMRFTAFQGGGVLGEERVMTGDLSGGYSVLMHRWPSLPIVETLGLEVQRQWRGTSCDIAALKPVVPIWYNCDMVYEPGMDVAWRSHDGVWHDREQRRYPVEVATGTDKLFNTALGPANRTIAGSFHFSDTTIRVLPLLARRDALDTFIDATFNHALQQDGTPSDTKFEVWGPDRGDTAHVYLTVTSFGSVTSTNDNIGDWARYELSFLVPVRRFTRDTTGEPWVLQGVGVVPAFTFVDNPTAAAANTEVLGIPTTNAEFIVPDAAWMTHDGPSPEAVQGLLQLRAEVLPVVGRGERAVRRTILRIDAGVAPELQREREWRSIADGWGRTLVAELKRKRSLAGRSGAAWEAAGIGATSQPSLLNAGRRLALEVLGNEEPVSYYTIKQYRDVAAPDRACYQSLVRVARSLHELDDLREIETPLTVRLHEYPTQPIVELLGLIGHELANDGDGIVYGLQPQRPFWMSVSMDEALGEQVAYRAGGYAWDHVGRRIESYLDRAEPRVTTEAETMLDQGDARRIKRAAREPRPVIHAPELAAPPSTTAAPTPAMAPAPVSMRDVLSHVDPQAVLDSILSREWGNWSVDARWRVARRELDARYAADLAGVAEGGVAANEERFFNHVLADAGRRPGEPPATLARGMIAALRAFTEARVKMEQAWEELARLCGRDHPDAEDGVAATAGQLIQGHHAFVTAVDSISSRPLLGIADSPELASDYRPRIEGERPSDAHLRLIELLDLELYAVDLALAVEPGDDAAAVHGLLSELERISEFWRATPRSGYRSQLRTLVSWRVGHFLGGQEPAPDGFGGASLVESELTPGVAARLGDQVRRSLISRRDSLREMVRIARDRCDMQRQALLNQLSRIVQKPDYVVWRGSTGTEGDRLFPMEQSWDEAWYVGAPAPPPAASQGVPGADQGVKATL